LVSLNDFGFVKRSFNVNVARRRYATFDFASQNANETIFNVISRLTIAIQFFPYIDYQFNATSLVKYKNIDNEIVTFIIVNFSFGQYFAVENKKYFEFMILSTRLVNDSIIPPSESVYFV